MVALLLSSILVVCLCSVGHGQDYIVSRYGGPQGDWGPLQKCPENFVAKGFSMKVEQSQGIGDDTAVNAIRLHCFPRSNVANEVRVTSTMGQHGVWSRVFMCKNSFLRSFSLRADRTLAIFTDDVSATNIKFRCSDGQELEGSGFPWGSYGPWNDCSFGICGISTRVQGDQGYRDDTSLNDVKFLCCAQP
ncbi:hypothetical protein GDO86_019986 [Hymenochirus boettgeri]|uniref:Vitelline membrane outer layer 1-like protein n=1 Tax=Hymenochirus boettgeri TaxID=247094 RepID=A0A8T2IJ50_9PIPI|nr:hypothetical protein GDO86_019986 [Hymenochirus boettgeri]